jgi:predicted homoserine dehydrogenase-like protein
VAWESILAGKHVVMLTVETDVVVGPILARTARAAGVVYTLAAGDQPGSILELYHWADSLGFDVVAAGRGTIRYPDDRHQGPHEETHGRPWISNSPAMVNSFRDGTKSQIEMGAVSNATGLLPDVRGMYEPQVAVKDLARVFAPKQKGGILGRSGVIELANAVDGEGRLVEQDQVGMGVFVVIDSEHPRVRTFLHQAHSTQSGEHGAALYRPYHMTCLEVPASVARAAVLGVATAQARKLHTEVVACAKRDLTAGERVDGAGGEIAYAVVEKAEPARAEGLVPFGLAEDARVTRPVGRDQPLTYDDLELRCDPFLLHLRHLQDATM